MQRVRASRASVTRGMNAGAFDSDADRDGLAIPRSESSLKMAWASWVRRALRDPLARLVQRARLASLDLRVMVTLARLDRADPQALRVRQALLDRRDSRVLKVRRDYLDPRAPKATSVPREPQAQQDLKASPDHPVMMGMMAQTASKDPRAIRARLGPWERRVRREQQATRVRRVTLARRERPGP